jgi:hypothetical protein
MPEMRIMRGPIFILNSPENQNLGFKQLKSTYQICNIPAFSFIMIIECIDTEPKDYSWSIRKFTIHCGNFIICIIFSHFNLLFTWKLAHGD